MVKSVLIVLIACALLIFGCTASPSPAQPAGNQQAAPSQPSATGQQPPAGSEQEPVANATAPLQEQEQDYTCALSLSPATIYGGESTDVGFSVSAKSSHVFTFNCGDEIREISTGGLTTGSRLCQFNTEGNVSVWIKADGRVCAMKTLTVLPRAQGRSCNVSLTSKDDSTHVYNFRVNFKGFEPSDNITWVCDFTTTTKGIGGSKSGQWLYQDLSCDYVDVPRKDVIGISIAGVECGQISTR